MTVKNFVVKFSSDATFELRSQFFQVYYGVDEDKGESLAIDYMYRLRAWES